ncbi:MAG: helix-turn-helix transcriptional regulator [Syntrophomonadaceae bacterium]|nr:helix-turn-helix transcriptional regulator [Syntrophomonadaceae bacterium]
MIYIIKHRLKFEREKKGWSQKYLSEKTGIPSSNISRYESGKRQPDIYTLRKLADLLECTADYLLGRTDNPPDSSPSGLEEIRDLLYRQSILKHKNTILEMDDIEDIITFVEIIVRKKHNCSNTRYIARAD